MQPASPTAPPPRSRLRSCLLVGCIGMLLLAIVPPLLLWSLASEGFEISIPDGVADFRETASVHPLPGVPVTAAEPIPAVTPVHPAAPMAERAELPPPPEDGPALPPGGEPELAPIPGARHGRIVLDVSMAELELVPVPAGSPLRLVARYDRERFELTENLREEAGGWVYELAFETRGMRWFNNTVGHNRLRLEVPQGAPVSIEGDMGFGASEIDLGGLAVDTVDLDLGAGEHKLTFSEPTAGAMARLKIDASMGELDVTGVGNGSPREVEIDHGMGELTLDLGGRWRNDGDVKLELGMGDCRVELPAPTEAAGIMVESSVSMGSTDVPATRRADAAPGVPQVRIRASGGMGNLRVR